MSHFCLPGPRRLALALLALAACAGCRGEGLPKTYPVRGQVIDAEGRPLGGAVVYLQSESHPTLTVTGLVGPDGAFSVKTAKDRHQVEGGAEGAYRVTVTPPITSGHAGARSVALPADFTVAARENVLEIDLRKLAKAPPP